MCDCIAFTFTFWVVCCLFLTGLSCAHLTCHFEISTRHMHLCLSCMPAFLHAPTLLVPCCLPLPFCLFHIFSLFTHTLAFLCLLCTLPLLLPLWDICIHCAFMFCLWGRISCAPLLLLTSFLYAPTSLSATHTTFRIKHLMLPFSFPQTSNSTVLNHPLFIISA